MRWFTLFLSFLLGKFNASPAPSLRETASIIFNEITYRSRKPATLLLGGLTCVLLLCGGFFMSLMDLTTQWDREGTLRITASMTSGLLLVGASLGVAYWIFNHAWPGVKEMAAPPPEAPPPPSGFAHLEQALAALIMDFVKEREERRERRFENPPPTPPREEEASPQYKH